MQKIQTPLFRGIGDEAFEQMCQYGGVRQKQFGKGETIFHTGDTVHELGIVLSGSVNIENIDLWGNKSILSHIPAGQVFAETYAYCGEPMMVDAVADEASQVLFLNLDRLLRTPHPECGWQQVLNNNLLSISLHKNLALSERIFCTSPKTIRGRLLLYLSNQSAKAGSRTFTIPFNRQALADYLNLDRSALSKELGKMRDEHLLLVEKNTFTLLDGME